MSNQSLDDKLNHILDFYSIVSDRDAIKKDLIDLIEDEKQESYELGQRELMEI